MQQQQHNAARVTQPTGTPTNLRHDELKAAEDYDPERRVHDIAALILHAVALRGHMHSVMSGSWS